jgi:hypothetical protein
MVERILRYDFLSILFMADSKDDKKPTERLKQIQDGIRDL